MKQFFVRVNGEEFQVEVEEIRGGSKPAPAPAPAPVAKSAPAAPAPAPAKAPAPAPAKATASGTGNPAKNLLAPMPGTVLAVKVKVGDTIKEGDILVVLEAMKLENHLTAAAAGTVVGVHTNAGESVNPNQLLVEIA